jgi:hypothetical protein
MADKDRWYLIDTPDPSSTSFVVVVPQDSVYMDPAAIPSPGDPFSQLGFYNGQNLGWIPDAAMATDERFGLYQYVDKSSGDGYVKFVYAAPKTDAQKNTPFRSSWKKHGNHRWPPILKSIVILSDNNLPRSANVIQNGQSGIATGPTYYDRYIYIPDCNEGTRFLLEEFFAATQFVIPRYRTPVATSVQFSIPGLNGSFPECLHPDIDIPPARTANAVYLGDQAFSGNGQVEGQFFPKTNFKTWLPYVLFDEQEMRESGWYRQRIRVFPPLLPKAIRRG